MRAGETAIATRDSRARAKRPRTRKNSDAGVRYCMELMAGGRWVSGSSHEAVAARYGVAPATVKDWATSASRVLRLHLGSDGEELRARLVATLETVVSTAMGGRKRDLRNAVAAIGEQGKLLGLHTEHHVHSGEVTEEQLASFRSAVVSLLCDGCRERVLEQVRRGQSEAT